MEFVYDCTKRHIKNILPYLQQTDKKIDNYIQFA